MFNKPCTSSSQAACILLFIVVLASSTYGNPLNKGGDSSTKMVVDFSVHVSEAGVEYNEKIEVDTEKQTELFQVPAHPGVDRSDVLHDFKQKLTMLRFPDSNTCYLLPLAKEQPIPEKLIRDLEKAEKEVLTEGNRTDSTWIVHGEVNERSFLSDDLRQFCTDNRIYLVKKAQDSLTATRIQTGEITKRQRKKRLPNDLCDGGMNHRTALGHCYKPRLKCKVRTVTCYKYVVCDVDGKVEPLRLRRVVAFRGYNSRGQNCWEIHNYANIVCCEYVCN